MNNSRGKLPAALLLLSLTLAAHGCGGSDGGQPNTNNANGAVSGVGPSPTPANQNLVTPGLHNGPPGGSSASNASADPTPTASSRFPGPPRNSSATARPGGINTSPGVTRNSNRTASHGGTSTSSSTGANVPRNSATNNRNN